MNSPEGGPTGSAGRRGATGATAGAPSIPDYTLLRRIGQGAYGEVWLARGLTGVLRAVKIVWRDRFAEAEPFEREFRGVKAAMTQALDAGQLALLHVGQDEAAGFFYYVMELADDAVTGRAIVPETYVPLTWKELKQRRGRLPAAEGLRLATAVTRALAGVHARGLVHRDIKPSNIVQVGGEPKLADVGLMTESAEALTLVGTSGYLPPEGPGRPAADVFALGRVLYELATGCDRDDYPRLPATFESAAERQAFFRLNRVIVRACEPEMGARFRDAAAMLTALEALPSGGRSRRGAWVAAGLAAAAVVAAGVWWRQSPRETSVPASPAAKPVAKADAPNESAVYARSIAVLPFASLSADPANAFFTDGVHEDVLLKLTSIPALRVVSRTTVSAYRDTKKSAREIGRELAVAYLLEGSVRREGGQVRLAGQLIDARLDRPVKALNYTRPLADIFSLQADLAETIAAELRAALTPETKAALERPLTANPAAYDAYLKARAALNREPSRATATEAEQMLSQAVELDPQFAAAWGELANVHSAAIFHMWDQSPARRAKADEAMAQALRLAPEAVETWRAQGIYFYQRFRDFDRAEEIFQKLRSRLPNDASVCFWLGVIQRRNLRWPESTANLQRATELEPSSGTYATALMQSYSALRRGEDCVAEERRRAGIVRQDPAAVIRSLIETKYHFAADPAEVDRELAALPPEQLQHPEVLTMQRARAFERGDLAAFRRYDDQVLAADESERDGDLEVAQQYAALGDPVAAKRRLGGVLERLRERVAREPGAAFGWGRLGLAEALVGHRDEALRCARKAVEAMPESGDAYFGPQISMGAAAVMAWCGETDWAIAELRRLVRNPASYMAGWLGRRVRFEPLKGDPRFRAIVDEVARYTPLSGETTPEMRQLHPLPERLAEPVGVPFQLPGRSVRGAATPPSDVSAAPPAAADERSIAVLPLVNVSGDRDQEYFADGLTDEIIGVLAREKGLQVAGRSSAFYYKGRSVPATEIGRALNVAQLVEGSVRRAGNRVRITVQVTRARDGYSETLGVYDRELTDVFALQDEVAQAVAARLTGRGLAQPVAVLTQNPEAYDAFLRGRALQVRSAGRAEEAAGFFEQAVKLDPQFALAWARLAEARFRAYRGMNDRSAAVTTGTWAALTRALELQPGLPEAVLLRAEWARLVENDLAAAGRYLSQVEAADSLRAELRFSQAMVARDGGDWEGALRLAREAVALDPQNGDAINAAALTIAVPAGRFAEADTWYARAMEIQGPGALFPYRNRVVLRAAWRGPEAALRLAERAPARQVGVDFVRAVYLLELGRKEEARALIEAADRQVAEGAAGSVSSVTGRVDAPIALMVEAGLEARAQPRAESVRADAMRSLGRGNAAPLVRGELVLAEILLGHREEAERLLAEWKSEVQTLPPVRRMFEYGQFALRLQAQLGNANEVAALYDEMARLGMQPIFGMSPLPTPAWLDRDPGCRERLGAVRAFAAAQPDPLDDPAATTAAWRATVESRRAAARPGEEPPAPSVAADERSIAVLPLDNLSPEAGDAYLTEGMHAEIIATLGRSAELKVISRGSTLAFKGSTERLADIGRKLGVGYLVTGNVRRQGSRVRIALELRRAADEALLWSPVFDRETADAFALQEEVADAVARQLRARERKGSAAQFMTKEPRAYDLYLRASELVARSEPNRAEVYRQRLKLAEQAYALDQNFMPAAELCARLNLSVRYFAAESAVRARAAAEAKRWAELASRLAPGGPGDGALSEYCLWVERDHRRALALAEGQVRALPNEAQAHERMAKALAALGRLPEAVAAQDRALALDPLNLGIRHNQIVHLAYLRRTAAFEAAVKQYELLAGDKADRVMILGYRFMVSGVLPASGAELQAYPYGRGIWFMLHRRFADQLANAQERLKQPALPAEARHLWLMEKSDALRYLGRTEEAEAAGREMLVVAEKLSADPAMEAGDGELLRLDALARAGRRAEALALGRKFVASVNEADEPAERWNREWRFALVCAVLGEKAEALGLLEKLVRVPGEITVPELRQDPIWDGLREEPRFQALLADPRNAAPWSDDASPAAESVGVGRKRAATAVASERSIGVLPFANLSGDKDQEYFSDGISEELLLTLAKGPELRVAARTSAFAFKGRDVPVDEIARRLGVAYVVEGSVRRGGGRVRIAARLVRASDGMQAWAESFDREVRDVLAVQSEIAGLVAQALRATLALKPAAQVDDAAYAALLEGRFFAQRENVEGWRRAVASYRRAVAADAGNAVAWGELARTLTLLARYEEASPAESLREARIAAERALAIDPDLAVAQAARGIVQRTADWDWRGAQASLQRALAASPGDARLLADAALVNWSLGRREPAVTQARAAVTLDPLNAGARGLLGMFLSLAGSYDGRSEWEVEAVGELRRAIELAPAASTTPATLACLLARLKRPEEARVALQNEPDASNRAVAEALLAAAEGRPDEARRIRDEMERTFGALTAMYAAQISATIGEADHAFEWLERGWRERTTVMAWVKSDPYLKSLHRDARWTALLRRMGLLDEQLAAVVGAERSPGGWWARSVNS